MEFPDDSTGNTLRMMHEDGDVLTAPRDIDFTVIFPTQDSALQFSNQVNCEEGTVQVERTDCEPELPWDVTVTKNMLADYATIQQFESLLQASAELWGGRTDGWGCFLVIPEKAATDA